MSSPVFGIGVEEDDDLEALVNSRHHKHPANMEAKVNQILEYVEQMQITTRDNNAILHQLMTTMEERINLKISNLRSEMIELIEKNTGNTVAPMQIPRPQSPLKGPARRASAFEMKSNPSQQVTVAPLKAEDIYDMVSITPHPGFVIKTRKLIGEKNKVFINVFHHELIALNPPGLPSEKAIDKPYMMMEEPTTAVDHSGAKCMTFNVGISSEYFTQPNPLVDINITAPVTIYKIIHKVNLKFNEFLDEGNYSIPRLTSGYKGDKVPVFKVPQEKAASSAPHAPMVTPSNNSNTVNKNGSPRPAGIASVWAATEGFDVPESQRRAPTPPVHVPDQSAHEVGADGHKAPSRRGSDNAMNDTDSVVSDITTNSTAHTNTLHGKAPTARRSSLNMLFGMGSGGGSRNGSFTENNGATAGVPAGVTAGAGAHRKISRKSVLISPGAAGYNGGAIQGRNLLSGDMLEYVENENIDLDSAHALKRASVDDPSVLLGWQIWVQGSDDEENNTIFVVTDVRKNYLSKTEFRISRYRVDDAWVKLKRVEGKNGLDFRPMRKVLFGLLDEDENTVA